MKSEIRDIFLKHGGYLRMSEAIESGITRYMLYSLRDRGVIEQISRGFFRLSKLPIMTNPDIAIVSLRVPNAVISLVSALAYHEITTQIPHEVSIFIRENSRIPVLDYPPVKVHRVAQKAFNSGIEEHLIDGVVVKIYNPEKTIADCFKFRNKIGMDVVLEALKLYKIRKDFSINKLIEYAKICRVENIMRPYLEMSL